MVRALRLLVFMLATTALLLADPTISGSRAEDDGSAKSHSIVTGKLIRSGESRKGTTRFALLDPEGSVTAYVIAADGADLRAHLNHQVGITASSARRGPDSIPYLLARKVSRLNSLADEQQSPGRLPDGMSADPLTGAIAEFSQSTDESFVDQMWKDVDDQVVQAQAQAIIEEPVPPPTGIAMPMSMPVDGSMVEPGSYYPGLPSMGSFLGRSGCGVPGCTSCGGGRRRVLGRGRWYGRLEYLAWWTKGMRLPPLVTTSPIGTPPQDAGVLGQDSTRILVGNQDVLERAREGGRLTIGRWFSPCMKNGLELEIFAIGRESEWLAFCSPGDPILARPFFNALLEEQDAELVAYPGILAGSVGVGVDSELSSFALRYRRNLRCWPVFPRGKYGCDDCVGCDVPCGPVGTRRLDATIGYRGVRLDDALLINERLGTLDTDTPSFFNLTDVIGTRNEFHGAEFGLVWECCRGPWSVELLSRLSLGNHRRSVSVSGATISRAQGVEFADPGGLLALSSNSGTFSNDRFTAIPELGINVGYQVTKRARVILGYSLLYWDRVYRAGDQVDLRVNPDLLPPPTDTDGPALPSLTFRDTNYWATGFNIGLDCRW